MIGVIILIVGLLIAGLFALSALNVIRPTERGVVERLGKYNRFASPGLNIVIPIIESLRTVNTTERMVNAGEQEVITKDNLNAVVDAIIYYKVKSDEDEVKNSFYNVDDVNTQIVSLARTTLRDIIGGMNITEANSGRNQINSKLKEELTKDTSNWGIEVVRAELKEIEPPKDVQVAMNKIVMAENEKRAATDQATAEETKADGVKRAKIKMAEGEAQNIKLRSTADAEALKLQAAAEAEARKLQANAEAEAIIALGKANASAIEAVNKATEQTFTEKAQMVRKLEAVEKAFAANSKIFLPSGGSLVNVIGGMADTILPIETKGGSQ